MTQASTPRKNKYEVSFSLNVLNHLGYGLYSNVPAVLSELVANAHDAAATRVEITIQSDRIEISDNGRGMSLDDINLRYLRMGYQKRKDELWVEVDDEIRHVMGRKGIGKLSTMSIANIIEVQTIKDGDKNGFIISRYDLDEKIKQDASTYAPTPIPIEQITVEQGMQVVLRDLRHPIEGVEGDLRTSLARRFTLMEGDLRFQIILNGTPITLKDRGYFDKIEYIWYFGEDGEQYANLCPNKKEAFPLNGAINAIEGHVLSGWIATTFEPKDIDDEQRTISIFANRKLIQEDITNEIKDAQFVWSYMIGDVEDDFMDADNREDIVTSDRQRIIQNDPRYRQLKQFLAREGRKIIKTWKQKRKEEKESSTSTSSSLDQGQLFNQPVDASAAANGDSPQPSTEGQFQYDTSPQTDSEVSDVGANGVGESAIEASTNQTSNTDKTQRPPNRAAETFFANIQAAVQGSALEQDFKTVILYDLRQAELAYKGSAFKASVVMLGAVLEGIMLGVLRRPDVIDFIVNHSNPPKILNLKGGVRHPDYADSSLFAQAVAEYLTFEDYRQLIEWCIPQTRELSVSSIQQFRNTIHPWESIQRPDVYRTPTPGRAMSYLSSLDTLAPIILFWKPEVEVKDEVNES